MAKASGLGDPGTFRRLRADRFIDTGHTSRDARRLQTMRPSDPREARHCSRHKPARESDKGRTTVKTKIKESEPRSSTAAGTSSTASVQTESTAWPQGTGAWTTARTKSDIVCPGGNSGRDKTASSSPRQRWSHKYRARGGLLAESLLTHRARSMWGKHSGCRA